MLHHHNKLSVLLGDLECRYGKDHPVTHDIREAFTKESVLSTPVLNTYRSMEKQEASIRIKHDEIQPV